MHPYIHWSITYNNQDMKTTRVSINGWMDKEMVFIMEYHSAIKKGDLAVCENMDEPWGYYTTWNESDRERQMLYNFTYLWNLKKQNNWMNKISSFLPYTSPQSFYISPQVSSIFISKSLIPEQSVSSSTISFLSSYWSKFLEEYSISSNPISFLSFTS